MDAELSYLFSNEPQLDIPAAKVALSSSQLISNSATNIGIASITASDSSSTATVTTSATHGLLSGEVVTIANNTTTAPIATVIGDGSVATVTTSSPHTLINGQSVTIAGNTMSTSNATITSQGGTATVVTTTQHGLITGSTIAVSYPDQVTGAAGNLYSGISSILGSGTTATVATTAPHGFATGASVYVSTSTGTGGIGNILPNTPTSGTATVYTSSVPSTAQTVTIAGTTVAGTSLYQWPGVPTIYTPQITTPSNTGTQTATAVLNVGTLPYGISTGNQVTISGVRVNGTLSSITGFGTTSNVYMSSDHALTAGGTITISGITGANSIFNGTFTILQVLSSTVIQVQTSFSSFASFTTSASWNSSSCGYNNTWTITGTGTKTVASVLCATFSFSTTIYSRSSSYPTYSNTGLAQYNGSPYNGSFTATPVDGSSFTITSNATVNAAGGTWSTSAAFNGGPYSVTVIDYQSFTFASSSTGYNTGGQVWGSPSLNTASASITYQDAFTFQYPTSTDTGGNAIPGFTISGSSGFCGTHSAITYIDGYNFSYTDNTHGVPIATIAGGTTTGASGFNTTKATVLTVPTTSSFTYSNNSAGTDLPYVFGTSSASGTVTTYDSSYTGLTTAQISWSQPSVFSINGMAATGRGITVPKNGWYKIIARVELSSTATSSYGNVPSGAYSYIDIYVNGALQARSNEINQQSTALEYGLLVSDTVYVQKNQLISANVTSFSVLNSGQIYAWGFTNNSLTYLSAVFVSA